MSSLETVILIFVLVAVFSVISIFIHYQKKSKNLNRFKYWFTNVDELL